MKAWINKAFKNWYVRGVVIGLSILILWYIVDWNLLFSFFIRIGNGILSILSYNLPIWALLLVFMLILAGIFLYNKIINKLEKESKPAFLRYVEESSDTKFKWTWSYSESNGAYFPTALVPHCPKKDCDTIMGYLYEAYNPQYRCPRCKKKYSVSSYESKKDALAIISDNILKKYIEHVK